MAYGDEQEERITELKKKVGILEQRLAELDVVRDRIWCESLVIALGKGTISTYQMADILGAFNAHRPK